MTSILIKCVYEINEIIKYLVSSKTNMQPKITYLNFLFIEKDQAKAICARWDKNLKQWYVHANLPLVPFKRWLAIDIIVAVLPQEKLPQENQISTYRMPQYTIRQLINGLTTTFYNLFNCGENYQAPS